MYEYHIMSHFLGASGVQEMQGEVNERAADGCELVTAYQESSGGFFGFFGRCHVFIFRREKTGTPYADSP